MDTISDSVEPAEPTTEETAQNIIGPDGLLGVPYVDSTQLGTILYGINQGLIPSIEPYSEAPYTYQLSFGDGHVLFINEHQFSIITEAIRGHEDATTEHTEPLPDSEPDSSPLSKEEEELLAQVVEEVHSEIPVNSGSLLVDESTSRFSSAIWYEAIQKKTILLAGVGGIGSYVGFLLARMKPDALFIYDPDIVETVNMSGQLYSMDDVGSFKVSALSGMISRYCDYGSTFAVPERFDESSEAADIMICGFDNMAARKLFFSKWVSHVQSKPEEERKNCLFIDGRIKC